MFFKNILFSTIIVAGFFATAELVLALAGVRPLLLSEDPLVGFAGNIPQFTKAAREGGAGTYITPKNKTSLFNYQEFPQHKGEDTYRIFCVGGSTTYGRPYRDKYSFCGWLRAYLRAADPSRNWEVINVGGISYASYRVARVVDELKDYQPDLFIVYSGQNEFLEERSYGALQELPPWMIDLDATLSGTRVYTAMKRAMDAIRPGSNRLSLQRDQLADEVDEVLNGTLGPQSYYRDDTLKQQIVAHYRMNLHRIARIADSVDAGTLFVVPVVNIRGISPFKSEHRNDLELGELMRWQHLYAEAHELQEAGDLDTALARYRQALAIDDRYAELHFRIGEVLFAQQRYEEAEVAYRRAVEQDIAPLRALASMQQAVAEVAAGEDAPLIDYPAILREAYLEEFGHTVFGNEYFPDHVHTNVEGYSMLGMALFDQLVAQGIARPDASWNTARAEAVERERLAGFDTRDEGLAYMSLGSLFEWAGKFEEAREMLLHALDIMGPHPGIYMRLASSSFTLNRHEDALYYLEQALALAPTIPGLHAKLALIKLVQGKPDEAIEYCQIAMELQPDSHSPHLCIAKALTAKGETDKARPYFDSALKLGPGSAFVQLSVANHLADQQRHDEALAHAREALRINPAHYKAHNTIASILLKQGDLEQAKHHVTEALRLKPDYNAAIKTLQRLQAGTDNDGEDGTTRRDI